MKEDEIRKAKIASDFLNVLGWQNPNLEYKVGHDMFILRSATMPPEHERRFNELYAMYKAGVKARQEELTELRDKMKCCGNCEHWDTYERFCADSKGNCTDESNWTQKH